MSAPADADAAAVLDSVVDSVLRGSGNERMVMVLPEDDEAVDATTAAAHQGGPGAGDAAPRHHQAPLLRAMSINPEGHPLRDAIAAGDADRVAHLCGIVGMGVSDADVAFAEAAGASAAVLALLREYAEPGDGAAAGGDATATASRGAAAAPATAAHATGGTSPGRLPAVAAGSGGWAGGAPGPAAAAPPPLHPARHAGAPPITGGALAAAIAAGDEAAVRHLVEVASYDVTGHDVSAAIVAGLSPALVRLLGEYAQGSSHDHHLRGAPAGAAAGLG